MKNLLRAQDLIRDFLSEKPERKAARELLLLLSDPEEVNPVIVFVTSELTTQCYPASTDLDLLENLIKNDTYILVNISYLDEGVTFRAFKEPELELPIVIRLDRHKQQAIVLPYYKSPETVEDI